MLKVKLLESTSYMTLEYQINNFIKENNLATLDDHKIHIFSNGSDKMVALIEYFDVGHE